MDCEWFSWNYFVPTTICRYGCIKIPRLPRPGVLFQRNWQKFQMAGQATNLEMFWKFQPMCQFSSPPMTVHLETFGTEMAYQWRWVQLNIHWPRSYLLIMYVVKWSRQRFFNFIQLLVCSLLSIDATTTMILKCSLQMRSLHPSLPSIRQAC